MMLFGSHPLLAYAIVGLGAAAYSPAKYGILTELLPASQLVKANGWIEGLTISSIILGVLLGGQLVGHAVSSLLLSFDFPIFDTGIDSAPEAAIAVLILLYVIAAVVQHAHPGHRRRDAAHAAQQARAAARLLELQLARCGATSWARSPLATTTLFWGVSGNLRYIMLAWSARGAGLQHHAGLLAGRAWWP